MQEVTKEFENFFHLFLINRPIILTGTMLILFLYLAGLILI